MDRTTPSPPSEARAGAWPRRGILVLLAVAALVLAACTSELRPVQGGRQVVTTLPSVTFAQSSQAPPQSSLALTIKRVLPSVVNVRVTGVTLNPFGGSQEVRAEGTGVVVEPNGIILTNNHVIAGAVKVMVLFTDGHKSLPGTVIGADAQHDLAVVRVDAQDLTPMVIGRSSDLELGDLVAAIGFPLDLGGPSVTQGIVSGLNRTVDVQRPDGGTEHLVGLLQTDAAINPGNSGGPLVNSLGQLVGINTAGVSASSAENVGFAIAIDDALPIVQQIVTRPPSQRAWMGVSVVSVSDAAGASQFGVPADTRGAGVVSVLPASPAASAGIRQGDVFVEMDGRPVRAAEDLNRILLDLKPGDRISVQLVSAGGSRSVQLTLASRPAGI
jgi:serine protease Do